MIRWCRAIAMALLSLAAPSQAQAAPAARLEDPSCASPSRFNIVLAGRTEAARRFRLVQRSGTLSALAATSPSIRLQWDRDASRPLLTLGGPAGKSLQLEAAAALPEPWQPLFGLRMGTAEVQWLDASAAANQRYYRLTLLNPILHDLADNFQLIDQAGRARELYYHTDLRALAVVAGGDSEERLAEVLPAAQALANEYAERGGRIWVVCTDPRATRSSLAARAAASGTDIPVLHDPYRLATRSVRLTKEGEVAVVQPMAEDLPVFNISYRGPLRTPAGDPDRLREALAKLAANETVEHFRLPAGGAPLTGLDRPVPDYATEIAPLLSRYCANCHRPNDVAPFAMTDYETVASWAPVIQHAVQANDMPPWHVDPEYGHWKSSLEMPGEARAALLRWLEAGAPRGEGVDPLPTTTQPASEAAWPAELGEPDALVTIPLQSVRADGIEPYRYLFVQAPNPSNVWLRAAQIRPSNPAVVHHYLIWTGRVGNQGQDGLFSTYQPSIAGYAPGLKQRILPPDAGYFLGTSNWLTFNLHYTPNGTATTDQPLLALWYHKTPPPKTARSLAINNVFIQIPPGVQEQPASAAWTAPRTTRIVGLNPHMHLRGKHARYEIEYSDGSKRTILSVPDYSFRWQIGYELAEPIEIPRGAKIRILGAFDNSPQNLSNPDPTATLTWGDQSTSEMFAMFVDIVE